MCGISDDEEFLLELILKPKDLEFFKQKFYSRASVIIMIGAKIEDVFDRAIYFLICVNLKPSDGGFIFNLGEAAILSKDKELLDVTIDRSREVASFYPKCAAIFGRIARVLERRDLMLEGMELTRQFSGEVNCALVFGSLANIGSR